MSDETPDSEFLCDCPMHGSDEIPAEAVEAAIDALEGRIPGYTDSRLPPTGTLARVALAAALPHLLADKDAEIERLTEELRDASPGWLMADKKIAEARARWEEQLQSDEAVEPVARAIFDEDERADAVASEYTDYRHDARTWESVHELDRAEYRDRARVALAAAAKTASEKP